MAESKLDPARWRAIRDGGARRLADALERDGASDAHAERIVTTYLALSADALDQGLLRWGGDGSPANVFTHGWLELLPASTGPASFAEHTDLLAAPWEIADRLSRLPVWIDALLLALAIQVDSIGALRALAADVLARVLKPPSRSLEQGAARIKLSMTATPLSAHFVAPAVACIHSEESLRGVWLDSKPLLFPIERCVESVPSSRLLPAALLQDLAEPEIEVGIANGWRALAIAHGECWVWLPA